MRQAFYTSKFYISKKSEKEVCIRQLESHKDDMRKLNKENAALRTRNKFILCFCIALIFLIVCLVNHTRL